MEVGDLPKLGICLYSLELRLCLDLLAFGVLPKFPGFGDPPKLGTCLNSLGLRLCLNLLELVIDLNSLELGFCPKLRIFRLILFGLGCFCFP